jgi:hypothetical protein
LYVKINYSRWVQYQQSDGPMTTAGSVVTRSPTQAAVNHFKQKSGTFRGQVRDIAEVRSGPSTRHEDMLDTISGIAEAKGGCCGSWTSAVGPGVGAGGRGRQ